MTTRFVRRSPFALRSRANHKTCSTISPALRCRRKPIWPVAQNTQPIADPACVEMQVVRRFSYPINTASMDFPSGRRKRSLRVCPSEDLASAAGDKRLKVNSATSFSRSALGRVVISSGVAARSRYIACQICRARKCGSPQVSRRCASWSGVRSKKEGMSAWSMGSEAWGGGSSPHASRSTSTYLSLPQLAQTLLGFVPEVFVRAEAGHALQVGDGLRDAAQVNEDERAPVEQAQRARLVLEGFVDVLQGLEEFALLLARLGAAHAGGHRLRVRLQHSGVILQRLGIFLGLPVDVPAQDDQAVVQRHELRGALDGGDSLFVFLQLGVQFGLIGVTTVGDARHFRRDQLELLGHLPGARAVGLGERGDDGFDIGEESIGR